MIEPHDPKRGKRGWPPIGLERLLRMHVLQQRSEIVQAMQDYRRTQFGGWRFDNAAPVHGRDPRRFARYPDGRLEEEPT